MFLQVKYSSMQTRFIKLILKIWQKIQMAYYRSLSVYLGVL